MAKANFGGQQDASQTFMFLYEQYAQRQQDLAERAIREAEAEQAAKDQDMMNKWQAGEISDAEWLAYANERLAASTDEDEKTQWREVIRDSKERITVHRIEDGARDIMNRIERGEATYQDLVNFYSSERNKLRPGSEMYRDLTDQIDQVQDQIHQNNVEGTIARAQYLFESGQISGAEAASMIRGAAASYATSDPGRYYSLLSAAYDLETYGATGGGSGGGGGLGDTIDSLEYTADAIDLLNDQFKNGKAVGTLPDGTEVPLRDENGNPTGVWREIDRAMIETLDAKYEAQVANGDRSAVETLQRKEQYLETVVQPRNTIPREGQFASFQRDLQRVIATGDPAAIQDTLSRMERWASRLNVTTRTVQHGRQATDAELTENPELGAANRRQVTGEADEIDQVTDEFVTQVQSTLNAYRQAFENPNLTPEQAAQIMAGAEGADQAILSGLQEVITKTTGLADGSMVRVMYPDGSMGVEPLVRTTVPGPPGPDGEPQMVVDLQPDVPIDDASQAMVQVLREINGRPQLVWAIGDYQPTETGRMLVLNDGRRAFGLDEQSGTWVDGEGNQVALPFFGAATSNAQRWVNQNPEAAARMLQSNGIDPSTVDLRNLFYRSDRLITDRENETQRDYSFMAQQQRQSPPGPTRGPVGYTPEPNLRQAPFLSDETSGRLTMPEQLEQAGKGLGINFSIVDPKDRGMRLSKTGVDLPKIERPRIRPLNIQPVRIKPLRLQLPNFNFGNLGMRRLAQAAQITQIRSNSPDGFI